jgi:hypothetical protein
MKLSDRWNVEIPNDVWVEAEDGGHYIGALYHKRVKRLIRDARRESIRFWFGIALPVLSALTGLAGAIIGILSFLSARSG